MKKIAAFCLSVVLSFSAIYGGNVFGSDNNSNSYFLLILFYMDFAILLFFLFLPYLLFLLILLIFVLIFQVFRYSFYSFLKHLFYLLRKIF